MLGGFADPDSIRVGTALISTAMTETGLRRIVIVQGFHLDFPGDPHNLGRKLILPMLRLGSRTLIADSRAMANSVRQSGLDWTVIRTPRITRGESTGIARVGALAIGPWNSVVNADVADLVLRCLDDPATIGTAPMIANGRSRSGRPVLGVLRTLHDIVRPPRTPAPPGAGSGPTRA
jgi:NAD(P)H-binding